MVRGYGGYGLFMFFFSWEKGKRRWIMLFSHFFFLHFSSHFLLSLSLCLNFFMTARVFFSFLPPLLLLFIVKILSFPPNYLRARSPISFWSPFFFFLFYISLIGLLFIKFKPRRRLVMWSLGGAFASLGGQTLASGAVSKSSRRPLYH
jgi:hypothetical protein